MLQAFNRGRCSKLHFGKINMTAGKEAAKRKVPETETPNESWGNGTHEKDQGLREARGPAKRKGGSVQDVPSQASI